VPVSQDRVIDGADIGGPCCDSDPDLKGAREMSSAVEQRRPPVAIQPSSWIGALSHIQRVLVSSGVALLVFLGGGALDWLVRRQLIPSISLMLAGAAISLAIGTSVLKILSDAHAHYATVLERLELISQLNHHIRNALQIIAYHNVPAPGRSEHAIRQVSAAVTRIDFVLRDMLPPRK
jgi:hypothetical protein